MYLPRIKLLPPFLRELFGKRTLQREPETALVMDDHDEVHAYVQAGRGKSMDAAYVFAHAHLSASIQGCRHVVDLCCGPATLLCQVASQHRSTRFTGVDLSETMLAQARREAARLGLTNVGFVLADATKLDFLKDGEVDGVITTFALHHLPTRGHLERCLQEVRRVLAPDGAFFLFDFARLKSVANVVFMAYFNSEEEPYLFTLDRERSMRAAFRWEDYAELIPKFLGSGVRLHSTFKVPMFVMAKTAPRPLPAGFMNELNGRRDAMEPKYRADLDDLRFFFQLGGLPDPFGSFVPGASQLSKLRMADLAALPVLGTIHTARLPRTLAILRLLSKAAAAFAWTRLTQSAPRRRDVFVDRLAKILRQELGALKGPLMKFGQMASYLTEDLPPALQAALAPLQQKSRPLQAAFIRQVVERELGKPVHKLFKEWFDAPIAAASISQLHLARLWDDRLVAVKVRYPGIMRAVRSDFFLLRCLAPALKKLWGLPNVGELLGELEGLILGECDFRQAAAYQEEFRRLFKGEAGVIIPEAILDYTTAEVLTMEYVEGKTYEEFKASSDQAAKNRAGEIIWYVAAASINRFGLYNADPHPGNYLFVGDKVAFVDFGFTKRFPPKFMALWKEQSLTGIAGDFEGFTRVNQALGYEVPGKTMDHRAMFDTYRSIVYKAWMHDHQFKFTRDFVRGELRKLMELQQNAKGSLRMPVEFVSILRLLWGQHAILADLEAESNWHRIVFPMLKEPLRPDPQS